MSARGTKLTLVLVLLVLAGAWGAWAVASGAASLPENNFTRVVFLRDYNTRVVVMGTALLGVAAGMIGSFTLLRKRALMGDALSHAMLPGIGLAFMLSVASGGTGKSLTVLLAGAAVSGLLGLGAILLIRHFTRLKEDTALGIVLSVFFGGGVAVLGVAQRIGAGHSAGLESFIYGKAASMLAGDAWLIAGTALLVVLTCTLLFKEFRLLCFDSEYASTLGWPTLLLDLVMMSLVVTVTVIGLQAVGLVLVIAMLIIPAAAARFWTEHLGIMTWMAAGIGAASGAVGSALSALFPDLPSGAMIVLVAAGLFGLSMLAGVRRGLLVSWSRRNLLNRKVRRQHLLRALFEAIESAPGSAVPREVLLGARSWSPGEFGRALRRAIQAGIVHEVPAGIALTRAGEIEAERVVRNHRLWELYLINHADIAPSHVDRDADVIEHVLDPEIARSLEELLLRERSHASVPASPHTVGGRA